MKIYILITVLTVFIVSCEEKTKKDAKNQTIKIEDLRPSPVVHKSLNESQLKKIKFIQTTFNEVYPVSLDETITNFKRDQNPDNEIKIWMNMADAFLPFTSKNQGEEKLVVRKEAFKLLLMRSMMSEKEAVKKSELKVLNDIEVKEIFESYTLKAKPIVVK